MRAKFFSLLSLSVLFLVMFMSLMSAVALKDITLVSSPSNVSEDVGSFDIVFNLTNEGTAGDLYYNLSNFTSSQTGLEFSFDIFYIEADPTTETITATISFDNGQTGTITGNINVGNTDDAVDETLDFSVDIIELEEPLTCECSEGSLNVNIDNVDLINGFGDDDEWLPFDEIEVEVEVSNNNEDEKIKDIEIKWGLWSEETNEWVIKLDDHNVDEIDLKKDDEEIITFKFKLNKKQLDVDLDELDEGEYTLYVIANGEEQERTPDESVCSIDSEAITIIIEDNFVILNNFEINGFELEDDYLLSDLVLCGSKLQITADVWNIGDSDQEDVYVIVYNKELGILDEKIEIGDIDAFEDEKLVFDFKVPKDAEEKGYKLWFTVYDEYNDVYENDYDEKESEFFVSLKVEGSCVVEPQVMVTATLESGGKAGEELVIKATVTNIGNNLVTYTLNAEEYDEWAELISIEPSTIILNEGESKDVLITFNVNKDVLGDKLFNIEVLSEDESVMKQPVSITIEKPGFGLSALTGNIISEGNWYLWGIGALNIILVIVIILVAVKVAKKSE